MPLKLVDKAIMKKYISCIILLLTFYASNIMAQNNSDDTSAKSAVYFNDGTGFAYSSFSLNYDHRIRQSDNAFFKNYYLNFRGGFFNRNGGFSEESSRNGFVSSIGIIGLAGSGNGHFEAGLSIALHIETEIIEIAPGDPIEEESFVWPDVSIGYRYQKEQGFMIRAGVGFPRGIFVGLGYSF